MSFEWDYIATTFILAFGLATLGSGLFTAYFGAGKSRTIGIVLTIIGAAFTALFYYLPWVDGRFDPDLVWDGFAATLGAMIGGAIGVGVILFVLMKVDTTEDLEDLDLDDLEDLDLDEELKKLEAELEAEEAQEAEETPEEESEAEPASEGEEEEAVEEAEPADAEEAEAIEKAPEEEQEGS